MAPYGQGKGGFVLGVYSLLAAQLVLTGLVARTSLAETMSRRPVLLLVGTLVLVVVIGALPLSTPVKLAAIAAFSLLQAGMFRYAADRAPPGAARAALVSSAVVFTALGVAGWATAASGISLAPWAPYLFAFTLAYLVVAIVIGIMKVERRKSTVLLSVAVLLFSMWTVYDTNAMLSSGYRGTAVDGAFDLYLDATSIFQSLLGMDS